MAEGILLHIAESLSEKLISYPLNLIKSCREANDDLQKLQSSIETIKAGLLDAEKRQHGPDREAKLIRAWLRRLKNVLYDADDLFDEVNTSEKSNQSLTGKRKMIGGLLSIPNRIALKVRVAEEVKRIREELDGIKSDMDFFKFAINSSNETVCKTIGDRETGSFVQEDEIIGREEDETKIMPFLLDPENKKEKAFPDVIAIVGFGGIGKTAFAQHLWQNKCVAENFELRAWACISEIKSTNEKMKIILKALESEDKLNSSERSGNPGNISEISVDELQQRVIKKIQNKKYLLVLDDVWFEDRQGWIHLRSLLTGGKTGSKIVVTTRSFLIADVLGAVTTCTIKGLADDKAWDLFKRLAFNSIAEAENQKLIEMGKTIVQKCKNVPLAIKVVASLLYNHRGNEKMWKSIVDSDMLTIDQNQTQSIIPVLKLSYDHLPSYLKQCFAFCSVFPKDYEMQEDVLVNYWIAQGYIDRSSYNRKRGLTEIGGSYLEELTRRSFLQRESLHIYRMHDLIHDLAQYVAEDEIFVAEDEKFALNGDNLHGKIKDVRVRHLSFIGVQTDSELRLTNAKYLRSFIHLRIREGNPFHGEATLAKLISSFTRLRILDIKCAKLQQLPSSVGDLKHLRCLIVSGNPFTYLPHTITELHNLMTLDVSFCENLEALPARFKRLINLVCINLRGCYRLISMPCEFGQLCSLERLDYFKVGDVSTKCSTLEAISELINLRGSLQIEYNKSSRGGFRNVEDEKRVDLSSLEHLGELAFFWNAPDEMNWEELEFECSKLPLNLKFLRMNNFPMQKLPPWESFNRLSVLYLEHCWKLLYLPSIQFSCITVLSLINLEEIEYIQEDEDDFVPSSHFPLLKSLTLTDLPKLKAWSPGLEKLALDIISSPSSSASFQCFRSLSFLKIRSCPELMSIPLPKDDCGVYCLEGLKEPLEMLMKPHKHWPW